MAVRLITAAANGSGGSWVQLDSSLSGDYSCRFYNESQAIEIVTNADNVTEAGDEKTANRFFKIPAGGIVSPIDYRFDPARTWIRSATTTASNVQVHFFTP